ncbi:MAG: hypothetical protein HY591_04785 [Candidatus Omnitrophica bacterium]|nr:hypothetical protein [Candidatus Omnitrophota bacterium]
MNAKLGAALVAVVAVCLGLSAALVYMAVVPRPVYYIPRPWEAGVALPQSMPQAAVASFVSSWVLNWSNFTPATVHDVYGRAQRFMSPVLLGQTQARLGKDIDQVKRDNVSSLFSMTGDPLVAVEKTGFRVTVQGDKGIYMGKDQIRTEHTTYRVRVRRVNPTDTNPYGLMIEEIDQESAS